MSAPAFTRKPLVLVVVLGGLAIWLAAPLLSEQRVRAQAGGDSDESRIRQGFAIAPVPLNLDGKNPALVGLGSYIVNATVPCNECHGAGPANAQYLPGGNPYMGQPKM